MKHFACSHPVKAPPTFAMLFENILHYFRLATLSLP